MIKHFVSISLFVYQKGIKKNAKGIQSFADTDGLKKLSVLYATNAKSVRKEFLLSLHSY